MSYYLDEQPLRQIARVLGVHEATISRKLHKVTRELRKQLLRNLQSLGLKPRAAEEALGTDPRDLNINLRKLLQATQSETFSEKSGQ
jgi:RNA polymerase sigma-70 factor (ECF subfamily)